MRVVERLRLVVPRGLPEVGCLFLSAASVVGVPVLVVLNRVAFLVPQGVPILVAGCFFLIATDDVSIRVERVAPLVVGCSPWVDEVRHIRLARLERGASHRINLAWTSREDAVTTLVVVPLLLFLRRPLDLLLNPILPTVILGLHVVSLARLDLHKLLSLHADLLGGFGSQGLLLFLLRLLLSLHVEEDREPKLGQFGVRFGLLPRGLLVVLLQHRLLLGHVGAHDVHRECALLLVLALLLRPLQLQSALDGLALPNVAADHTVEPDLGLADQHVLVRKVVVPYLERARRSHHHRLRRLDRDHLAVPLARAATAVLGSRARLLGGTELHLDERVLLAAKEGAHLGLGHAARLEVEHSDLPHALGLLLCLVLLRALLHRGVVDRFVRHIALLLLLVLVDEELSRHRSQVRLVERAPPA
mmetsp:Transcript_89626/g.256053  ORF Transcript_89626/g.256053 Transcript_89626/m.256053 type:complete len:417 (-) Transcript_89626:5824-7074(-)